jgi:chromosome transmission fidelity protein 18
LDEIDGIDGRNSLDVLINIIKAPLRRNKQKGSKGNTAFALTRPLICICNDQFAPSLRELRALSNIFVFTPPSDLRLSQRLKAVCVAEGLHVSSNSLLNELCGATGGDIRSSINNLQFAALKTIKLNEIKMEKSEVNKKSFFDIGTVLQSMMKTGLKDENLDIFQVWMQVFTINKKNYQAGKQKLSGYLKAIEAMNSFGDNNLVLSGNYKS